MFAPLYKKTSTGATQMWAIRVEGSTIITTYGQVGGAQQVTTDTITEGKNVGRANETTPAEQAVLEARSDWEKKLKRGYHTDIDAARSGAVSADFIAGGVNPMLAQSYAKHAKKITFPAAVQPKLDGHRCIAMVEAGGVTLWSRTRKPITGVPHIARAIEAMDLPVGTVLDGELYHHDYRNQFEKLTSFIRQAVPKPGHEIVQYHVYDMISEGSFCDRSFNLGEAVGDSDVVVYVETTFVKDEDAMFEAFSEMVADGYEGLMVRNLTSPYLGKRSYDLQKVKEMQDAEFEIVGVEEGRGRMAGRAIFVCRTAAGETFNVKMKGALETLEQYVQDPSLAIGRMLTVQFQDLTAAGLPRFPVGLRFRVDL